MIGGTKNKRNAFTMIELLVGVAIFSIIMLIILQSFLKVIEYNRKAVQNQGIQDHSEYIFQLMSREIQMAKINYSGDCNAFYTANSPTAIVVNNQIYATSTDVSGNVHLSFQNAYDECVHYYTANDGNSIYGTNIKRIKVDRKLPSEATVRSAWVTPRDITVLKFTISSTKFYDENNVDRHHPSTVNYYIKLRSTIWAPPEMEFTNFITARNAEQF